MAAAGLDTHRIVKRLRDAGASEQLAETVTDVLRETRELDLSGLATKADLDALRLGTKADLAEVRREIADARAELVKWMFGIAAGQLGLLFAFLKLFPGGTP